MADQALDPALVNELGRILFIVENPVEEGTTFEEVKEERQKLWIERRSEYVTKARKFIRVAGGRGKLSMDFQNEEATS